MRNHEDEHFEGTCPMCGSQCGCAVNGTVVDYITLALTSLSTTIGLAWAQGNKRNAISLAPEQAAWLSGEISKLIKQGAIVVPEATVT